jgi:hypothetical protein
MTWYASEVLARCTPPLLAAVLREPQLAPHTYLVCEPIEYELDGGAELFRPPPAGLLVVRPICDPRDDYAEWHNSDVVSWGALDAPGEEVLLPQTLGPHVGERTAEAFPPVGFLRYLKRLAKAGNTDLVFFCSFMWGGSTEFEYAWSFGSREELSLVVRHGRLSTVARSHTDGTVELVELDLLSDSLAYLGSPIPSPFCLLHTRSFRWEDFRATNQPGDA